MDVCHLYPSSVWSMSSFPMGDLHGHYAFVIGWKIWSLLWGCFVSLQYEEMVVQWVGMVEVEVGRV